MDPSFTSGGPGRWSRIRLWARTYRVPVMMTVAFVGVALVLAVLPAPGRSAARSTPAPTPEPPERSPCVACGIGQRCDETTRMCVLVEETPIPCREGTTYDADEGYCVPDPTPVPTAVPEATLPPDAIPRSTPRSTPLPTSSAQETPEPDDDDDEGGARTPEPAPGN